MTGGEFGFLGEKQYVADGADGAGEGHASAKILESDFKFGVIAGRVRAFTKTVTQRADHFGVKPGGTEFANFCESLFRCGCFERGVCIERQIVSIGDSQNARFNGDGWSTS